MNEYKPTDLALQEAISKVSELYELRGNNSNEDLIHSLLANKCEEEVIGFFIQLKYPFGQKEIRKIIKNYSPQLFKLACKNYQLIDSDKDLFKDILLEFWNDNWEYTIELIQILFDEGGVKPSDIVVDKQLMTTILSHYWNWEFLEELIRMGINFRQFIKESSGYRYPRLSESSLFALFLENLKRLSNSN